MLLRLFLLSIFLISVQSHSIEDRIAVAEANLRVLKDQLVNQHIPSTTCNTDAMDQFKKELVVEFGYGNFPQNASDKLYDMCLEHLYCQLGEPTNRLETSEYMVFKLLETCNHERFRRGPYHKCVKKIELDTKTFKVGNHFGQKPRCVLSEEEFMKLAETINEKCDKEAWRDMINNMDRVKEELCHAVFRDVVESEEFA